MITSIPKIGVVCYWAFSINDATAVSDYLYPKDWSGLLHKITESVERHEVITSIPKIGVVCYRQIRALEPCTKVITSIPKIGVVCYYGLVG